MPFRALTPDESSRRTPAHDPLQAPPAYVFHLCLISLQMTLFPTASCYNVPVPDNPAKKEPRLPEHQVTINLDNTPIFYTDNVMVTSNEDGVVFDFCQRVGSSPQVRVVARIGMSREHAKKLFIVLTGQLERTSGNTQTSGKAIN